MIGHQRDPAAFGRAAMQVGIGVAQNHDRDADDDEGQERADVDHVADVADGDGCADDGDEKTDDNRVRVQGVRNLG